MNASTIAVAGPRESTWLSRAVVVGGFVFALVLIKAPSARAQAQVSIENIQIGFQSIVKPGYWIPIAIDIKSVGGTFSGTLELTTPDGDGLPSTIVTGAACQAGEQRPIWHFIKLGHVHSVVQATIRDPSGKELARREFDLDDPTLRLSLRGTSTRLIAYYGSVAGLYEASEQGAPDLPHATARCLTGSSLPTQWFAYESLDSLVLATSVSEQLEEIDAVRAAAIKTWVRQGGKLIVSVGRNWQVVAKSFLGEMLPARLDGMGQRRSPADLEAFAGSELRMNVSQEGLPVAKLAERRGTVLVGDNDLPLMVRGSYGLGSVTLITFDVDQPPFQSWKGGADFWRKALGFTRAQSTHDGVDLAAIMHQYLETFPDVTIVPFGLVAALIFFYILLIGPVDYFFLKRVIGRLELTWITFPTIVAVVSVGSYYAAAYLKGSDLRVSRVEILDVDAATRTMRGTTFVSIFSPRIARYNFYVEPGLGANGTWTSIGMPRESSPVVCSWLGLPDSSLRGVQGQGGGLLGRSGYFFDGPDATGLMQVPINIWSVKSFQGRWLAAAGNLLDVELKGEDVFYRGSITNRTNATLTNVWVLDHSYAVSVNEIGPGQTVAINPERPKTLRSLLLSYIRSPDMPIASNLSLEQRDEVLRTILLAGQLSTTPNQQLHSRYWHDLDLSEALRQNKVMVMASTETPLCQLSLSDAPGKEPLELPKGTKAKVQSVIRVIVSPKGSGS